jgi:hypothetical protein
MITNPLFFSICLLVTMLSQPVYAQTRPFEGRGPQRGMEQRMERLQNLKKLRLMEVLHLGEEASIRFFARYNKFEEELRDLEEERNALIDRLERQLDEGGKPETYQDQFNALFAVGQKVLDVRVRFYNEIRSILSPEQVAGLIVFERNFNRQIREMIQDVQRGRGRGISPR